MLAHATRIYAQVRQEHVGLHTKAIHTNLAAQE